MNASDLDRARERGRAWLEENTAQLTIRDPYAGAVRAIRRELGLSANLEDLVEFWASQVEGCSGELRRYPWLVSYRRWINPPHYAGAAETWRSWRAAERQLDRAGLLSYWLAVPIIVCANGEILEELAAAGNARARTLLDSFMPVMRKDFAKHIIAEHPWTDTFALWCLSRTRLIFPHLQPIAIALASTFAASARTTGHVAGYGFPYYQVPLASGSAHLGASLLSLGIETSLVSTLLEFLTSTVRPSGGWGDGADPEDALTSFVAADLLAAIDPGYDPMQGAAYLLSQQEAGGAWRAMGPEMPWLTGEIVRWLGQVSLPFSRRFRWPRLSDSNTDSKTRLPGYGYFRSFEELCAGLPGLSNSPIEMAFLDLAGFKPFNDRFGQDTGDEVIVLLAQALSGIPDARAVRDGGDEFLIVGPPTDPSLEPRLKAFTEKWPALFRDRFGADAPVVAPRISLGTGTGGTLKELREKLGRSITQLKREAPKPEPGGILKRMF